MARFHPSRNHRQYRNSLSVTRRFLKLLANIFYNLLSTLRRARSVNLGRCYTMGSFSSATETKGMKGKVIIERDDFFGEDSGEDEDGDEDMQN
ncbi:hypothetical protein PHLCEN_2v4355 [Hermanssonia centrifuga]|uniref:Uncharacterized protein n=1 Tax=Hermanssonia centrifuga TaxID=98765 RepID=A0A2R6PV99_9APHY|nr:hypothetical protein PHLCEN_2v4355 [Hermanssonia centrifuga]